MALPQAGDLCACTPACRTAVPQCELPDCLGTWQGDPLMCVCGNGITCGPPTTPPGPTASGGGLNTPLLIAGLGAFVALMVVVSGPATVDASGE